MTPPVTELRPRAPAASDSGEILASIRARIEALKLDLAGLTVVTEAATGAYACTPVIAAMAGAERVHAIGRASARYGSVADAERAVMTLAERAGVAGRIQVSGQIRDGVLEGCDILTNSGALRPITRTKIGRLPRDAVIALMFEAWEFRATDLDLAACRKRGIRVAAVNECHPDVAVFPYLGPLAVRLLTETGLPVPGLQVAVLCDNPFAPYIRAGLEAAGATCSLFPGTDAMQGGEWDAVLVALDPARNVPLGRRALTRLAALAPNARIAQFWGDIDRRVARHLGLGPIWPVSEPAPGHMGLLLNSLGHEPIVRLQTGGLRAAAILRRGEPVTAGGIAVPL